MLKQFTLFSTLLLASVLPIQAQDKSVAAEPIVEITDAKFAAQVGEDLLPIVPTELFKPTDTIFLSVSTNSSIEVPGSLGVAWRYTYGNEQQAVHSEGKEIVFSGTSVTVFQISKPDGWPDGEYSAEIFLNGKSARKLTFKVL